ncbi:hypothetical protein LCGC14_1246220 [marine sediment metagenome]|uniref:Uncharacterized protein n=1 Tax=marine sediment metagenome TaxID=412755 RepID=A0A0F9LRD2_9ZZZZ
MGKQLPEGTKYRLTHCPEHDRKYLIEELVGLGDWREIRAFMSEGEALDFIDQLVNPNAPRYWDAAGKEIVDKPLLEHVDPLPFGAAKYPHFPRCKHDQLGQGSGCMKCFPPDRDDEMTVVLNGPGSRFRLRARRDFVAWLAQQTYKTKFEANGHEITRLALPFTVTHDPDPRSSVWLRDTFMGGAATAIEAAQNMNEWKKAGGAKMAQFDGSTPDGSTADGAEGSGEEDDA